MLSGQKPKHLLSSTEQPLLHNGDQGLKQARGLLGLIFAGYVPVAS